MQTPFCAESERRGSNANTGKKIAAGFVSWPVFTENYILYTPNYLNQHFAAFV